MHRSIGRTCMHGQTLFAVENLYAWANPVCSGEPWRTCMHGKTLFAVEKLYAWGNPVCHAVLNPNVMAGKFLSARASMHCKWITGAQNNAALHHDEIPKPVGGKVKPEARQGGHEGKAAPCRSSAVFWCSFYPHPRLSGEDSAGQMQCHVRVVHSHTNHEAVPEDYDCGTEIVIVVIGRQCWTEAAPRQGRTQPRKP
eukprot:1161346-Pelagomonas_calceolata.AAC.3